MRNGVKELELDETWSYKGEGSFARYYHNNAGVGMKLYHSETIENVWKFYNKYLKAYKLNQEMFVKPLGPVYCKLMNGSWKVGILMEHCEYPSLRLVDVDWNKPFVNKTKKDCEEFMEQIGIYNFDLHSDNILVDYESEQVKFIDLDDVTFKHDYKIGDCS